MPEDSPVIIYVGRLSLEKRPMDLLRAFQELPKPCKASLVYIGEGPLLQEMESFVARFNLENVYFEGFKSQEEIPKYYAVSDVLVIPSEHDNSPKVLNEAMNFGIPTIVTDFVGTGQDMVSPGESGFIYSVGDIGSLVGYLSQILEDPELGKRLGERSIELVSEWSFDNNVKGIYSALHYIHQR